MSFEQGRPISAFYEDLSNLDKGEPVSKEARIHWSIVQLYDVCANRLFGFLTECGSVTYDPYSNASFHEKMVEITRRSMDNRLRRQGMALDVLYVMKKHAEQRPMAAHDYADLLDARVYADWILKPSVEAPRKSRIDGKPVTFTVRATAREPGKPVRVRVRATRKIGTTANGQSPSVIETQVAQEDAVRPSPAVMSKPEAAATASTPRPKPKYRNKAKKKKKSKKKKGRR